MYVQIIFHLIFLMKTLIFTIRNATSPFTPGQFISIGKSLFPGHQHLNEYNIQPEE